MVVIFLLNFLVVFAASGSQNSRQVFVVEGGEQPHNRALETLTLYENMVQKLEQQLKQKNQRISSLQEQLSSKNNSEAELVFLRTNVETLENENKRLVEAHKEARAAIDSYLRLVQQDVITQKETIAVLLQSKQTCTRYNENVKQHQEESKKHEEQAQTFAELHEKIKQQISQKENEAWRYKVSACLLSLIVLLLTLDKYGYLTDILQFS